jgi:hypothetical protein
MSYKKIKAHKMTNDELRDLWRTEYCLPTIKIQTTDGILVKFYEDMFDHCFFESDNRKKGDKSILSYNRLEKMLWIKDTLSDPTAILKLGWDRDTKSYTTKKRVALVKENYVVIISLIKQNMAKFITAYEIQEEENISKILGSPDWP